jgi:Uncharacterized protein with SCP/PR1 domains
LNKKLICLILILTALTASFALLPDYAAMEVRASANYGSAQLRVYARKVASMVNSERVAAGLAPLRFSEDLCEVALVRADECTRQFDHVRPDGTLCFTAFDEGNIPYLSAGENIALGQTSPEAVMEAWMNSDEHRDNILSADFDYIGVGVCLWEGCYYWTQLFTGGEEMIGELVPYISVHPQNTTMVVGSRGKFEVKAVGSGLSYQWYYKKADDSRWNLWNGHTESVTYGTVSESWDGMQVRCLVTDGTGMELYSKSAVISAVEGPVITLQPKNVTVVSGATAVFEVSAEGNDLVYQWYYRKAGASGWSRWNGHTAAVTSGTANESWNGMQVFCRVTDAGGISADSETAVVTVKQPVVISAQPKDVTVAPGAVASFEITASGEELQYQWYYKKTGAAGWSRWNGHTTASTSGTASDSWDGMQVFCRVTDAGGSWVDSRAATVTVRQTIFITSQPKSVTVYAGQNVTFEIKASGEGLSYQWYYKKSSATVWSKWKGHTAASTSAVSGESWDGMKVYCRVTDSTGAFVDSDSASVSLIEKVVILRQPQDVIARAGRSVSFSVVAKGDGLTYQWYYRKAGASDWSVWKGHTSATTTAVANESWNGMKVRCLISGGTGQGVYSGAATVTFESGKITLIYGPENAVAAAGETVTFSAAADGDGLSCQWYYRKAGASVWSVWKGHDTPKTSATANATWDGMKVFCLFTDQYGNTASSGYATIYVLNS